MSVAPPFDHGVTWSASISLNFQIRFAFASWPMAQSGQFFALFAAESVLCFEMVFSLSSLRFEVRVVGGGVVCTS